MKAAVFQRVGEPLAIEELSQPVPGEGEVVIKVGRCGICGTDLHQTDGHSEPVPRGTVLGHEFSGEVIELGKGVGRLKVGDKIAVMPLRSCGQCAACLIGDLARCSQVTPVVGGYAQFAKAGERESILLPSSLSMEDGALVEPLSVALHGVTAAKMRPGVSVMVMGAGPIGLGAIFWARRLGAGYISVIEGNPARRDLAYAMGADTVMPPASAEIKSSESVGGMVISRGEVDRTVPEVVFEIVGRPGLIATAMEYSRVGGTIISMGVCMSPDQFVPAIAGAKQLTFKFPTAWTKSEFEMSVDMLDKGAVEPRMMITETVGLEETPALFESMRTTRTQCKVMIDPWA